MAHQRGNDSEIDATIHQMSRETVPQRARRDVGRSPARAAAVATISHTSSSRKRRLCVLVRNSGPRLPCSSKIGEQLGIERFGIGNARAADRPWP